MQLNLTHNIEAEKGLKLLPSEEFYTCVTSPPYFGLRNYGHPDQLGQEETPEQYVERLVRIFRQVRRTLRPDGTLWLNLGDSYAASSMKPHQGQRKNRDQSAMSGTIRKPTGKLKPKDLIGIPWMVAFALRDDGWYLRQDIIWSKPNPMPESVYDRCTKAHEYIFLFSKNKRYYYDQEAIAVPVKDATIFRMAQRIESQKGSERVSRLGVMRIWTLKQKEVLNGSDKPRIRIDYLDKCLARVHEFAGNENTPMQPIVEQTHKLVAHIKKLQNQ
jgi:DNA modification methylase